MATSKRSLALVAASCGIACAALAAMNSFSSETPKPLADQSPIQVAAAASSDLPQVVIDRAAFANAVESLIAERAVPKTQDRIPAADDPIVVAALPPQADVQVSPVPVAIDILTVPAPKDEIPNLVQILDECFVLEVCVDHYLFELYQRTAKLDASKVHERRKVKVKRKGKLVTVTRRITKVVSEDFTWKDPHAAEKAGMSMMDYVIGGMDRDFKLRLYQALRAAEHAGHAPGITSGFRDDYRQSIASGLKAASNRSYHGGSLRGGYGHGAAVDVVSTKGATRAQRWVTTVEFWKWIDANEQQFGVGRPYLQRDPPHVAPTDGVEFASRRGIRFPVASAELKQLNPVVQAPARPKQAAAAKGKRSLVSAKQKASPGRTKLAAAKRG